MSIIMNIGFNIPLIHYYGIYGAAIATTLSGIITNLINIYYSQKYTPIFLGKKSLCFNVISHYFYFNGNCIKSL